MLYARIRISDMFKDRFRVGSVLSLLWFKRRLSEYAMKFIEMGVNVEG